MLPDRINWLLRRRKALSQALPNFKASFASYATADCKFEGHNSLAGSSFLQHTSLGTGTYANAARLNSAVAGRFCSIGFDAIVGVGEHPLDRISSHPLFYSSSNPLGVAWVGDNSFSEVQSVHIGSDVWIGARAIVLGGVKIGSGAVIAAGALVTKEVPPYAVVAGVPAKVIRFRFDDEVIAALLDLRWWDAPVDSIRKCAVIVGSASNLSLIDVLRESLGEERRKEAWS